MNEYANMNKVIPATLASYFHLLLRERNLGVNTSDHCVIYWFRVKYPPSNTGALGSILALGKAPGEGNGNPLQYSCLGSPMDRGAWWATVHGLAELDVTA